MTRKVTKRDMFTRIVNLAVDLGDAELEAFAENEIALLDRKRAGAKGMTKTQRENVAIKQEIVRFLNTVDAATATEVANATEIKVQKATALLKQLVNAQIVVRDATGKRTLFAMNEALAE